MHYCQWNISDYLAHTAHLDDMEDLAYRRMLELYYLTEQPLPLDIDRLSKLIRMRTHCECIADVLREFFMETEEGFIQKRVEEELTAFRVKSDKARKSAEARWASKASKDKGKSKRNANALRPQSESNATHNTIHNTHNTIIKDISEADASDLLFVDYVYESILRVAPKAKKPNRDTWAKHVRRMREIDGLTPDEIQRVFDWANSNPFWSTNVLSTEKLRKNFPRLHAEMNKPTPPSGGGANGTRSTTLLEDLTDTSWAD